MPTLNVEIIDAAAGKVAFHYSSIYYPNASCAFLLDNLDDDQPRIVSGTFNTGPDGIHDWTVTFPYRTANYEVQVHDLTNELWSNRRTFSINSVCPFPCPYNNDVHNWCGSSQTELDNHILNVHTTPEPEPEPEPEPTPGSWCMLTALGLPVIALNFIRAYIRPHLPLPVVKSYYTFSESLLSKGSLRL